MSLQTRRDPGEHFFDITPDDANDLPHHTRAIFIETGGTICFIGTGDTASITRTVPGGVQYPWQIKRILTSGTATGLMGIY